VDWKGVSEFFYDFTPFDFWITSDGECKYKKLSYLLVLFACLLRELWWAPASSWSFTKKDWYQNSAFYFHIMLLYGIYSSLHPCILTSKYDLVCFELSKSWNKIHLIKKYIECCLPDVWLSRGIAYGRAFLSQPLFLLITATEIWFLEWLYSDLYPNA
jgi:hypothetical protein